MHIHHNFCVNLSKYSTLFLSCICFYLGTFLFSCYTCEIFLLLLFIFPTRSFTFSFGFKMSHLTLFKYKTFYYGNYGIGIHAVSLLKDSSHSEENDF